MSQERAAAKQPFIGAAAAEAASGGVMFIVLTLVGLGCDAPIWLLAAASAVMVMAQMGPAARALSRHAWQRRVELRIGLSTSGVAVLTFGSGWGSLMIAGLIVQVMADVRQYGSRVWRPSLVWCVVTGCVGQALVAFHSIGTNLPVGIAHGAFVSGLGSLVIFSRMYGTTTERLEHEIAARSADEARFRSLVQNSNDLVVLLDHVGDYVYVSPASDRVIGHSPEWLIEHGWHDLVHPDDLAGTVAALAGVADGAESVTAEVRAKHADGSWRWWEFTASNRLHDPAVNAIVCNVRDVTERRLYQEKLSYQATRDALTGLVNRAAFIEALDSALSRARRHIRTTAVLFLDLDGFKAVNDTWGHHAGDVLLQTVARRLQATIRPGDTVGRLAGDEFTVLLEDLRDPAEAFVVAERVTRALQASVTLEGVSLVPVASVGVAVTQSAVESADDLIRAADLAMYQVKQERRGRRTALPGMPLPRTSADDVRVERS